MNPEKYMEEVNKLISGQNKKRVKVEFIEAYIRFEDGNYQYDGNYGTLVRCRDCIYFEPAHDICGLAEKTMYDDDFCSRGKRKG